MHSMVLSFLNRPKMNRPPPRTGPEQRLYAIGDIHGRIDLHTALIDQITADAAQSTAKNSVLIYLGDYIDRGPGSDQLIETLSGPPPNGFTAHHMMGNHEEMLLSFYDGLDDGALWLKNGGVETLAAYGCRNVDEIETARRDLRANLPAHHLDFMRSLKINHQDGDYLFVHAGLKPGVAIEKQSDKDMKWIRTAFLKSKKDFGKFVIHGHSIEHQPDIHDNRIGIDTGAWRTGVLTCLVLDGADRKFLST